MKKKLLIPCFLLIALCAIKLNSQEKKTDLEKGKELLFYGKPKEAVVFFENALNYYKADNNEVKIAESHNQLSEVYRSLFKLEKAMFHAKKALGISRSDALDKRQEAYAFDNTALIYEIMRKFDLALSDHNEALRIRSEYFPEDSLSHAFSYLNIGKVLIGQSRYKDALDFFDKALKPHLKVTPENQIFLADVNLAISEVYYDQGKFDDALFYLEKGLQIAKQIFDKENPYFAKIYNKLGVIYSMKEELNTSLNYYQKALSVSIKTHGVDKHFDQVKIHFNMGTIYQKQGFTKKALFHTQKTLDLGAVMLGEEHVRMSLPYSQMGQIYGNEKGILYIEKALGIHEKQSSKNSVVVSYLHEYLSRIYFNINDYPKALEEAERALKIRLIAFGENNVHSIRTINMISKLYIALEDYEEALNYNQKALRANEIKNINEDLLLESVKIKADIYFKLYKKKGEEQYLQESIGLYKRAISLIDNARERKRNYDDKIAFSETVKSIYAKNIETSLLLHDLDENNSLEESFYFSEKSRANVLRELMKNTEAKESAYIPKEVLEVENSIDIKIASLNSQVLKEVTRKEIDSQKIYDLEGQLLDEFRRKDSIERTIETNFPVYHKLKYDRKKIQVSQVQEKLNDDTTLIEFFKSDDLLYTFILTKNSFDVKKLHIENLDQKILDLNESIVNKNQASFLTKSFELYQSLFKPIKEDIMGENLIIIPDESLWHLQFDLLLTKEYLQTEDQIPYLLHDYAISYGNSASLFFDTKSNNDRSKVKDECIAFSYSNDKLANTSNTVSLKKLRNSKTDLPGTRKEILEISKLFEGTYFYGNNANETNFKENVSQYKLVHLALHGEIDHVNPKNSKIYFTDSEDKKEEDNTLFGHELYALNVPAELVVLSACNTGSGRVNTGEGILSLGNAFQYAGAKSLLLSRWEISDKTTPVIIKNFYDNLAQGMTKSKALQKAKIQFLENSDTFQSAPFYWGSFYLLGNVDPISIEPTTNYLLILSIVITGLILIAFFKRITNKNNNP